MRASLNLFHCFEFTHVDILLFTEYFGQTIYVAASLSPTKGGTNEDNAARMVRAIPSMQQSIVKFDTIATYILTFF